MTLPRLAAYRPGGQPTPAQLAFVQRFYHAFLENHDKGPPAAPLLSVRAARRAIAADPDDGNAYLRLAEAYRGQLQGTEEKKWATSGGLARFAALRQIQMATALQHALTSEPDSEIVHERLSTLYSQMHFQDLALKHMEKAFKLKQERGPAPKELKERFTRDL